MRRRRRGGKRKAAAVCVCAAVLPAAVSAASKAAPHIAEAAERLGSVTVGIENDPDKYTGEMKFNVQELAGVDYLSEGFGWSEEAYEAEDEIYEESEGNTDKGEKPYPESWNADYGSISKTTFERSSGNKFFGLDGGGQVKNETDISNGKLLEESRLLPEFTIKKNGEPQVLIMHTHTTESFEPYERDQYDESFNYRTTDPSRNMVMVGDAMARELEKGGIGCIHDTTIHDYPSYNGSYDRSAETVKKILAENPSIKIVLDIHRDAIASGDCLIQPVTEIDGKEAAQVMIISGCDDGTMDMPDYMKNFRFASLLQQQMSSDYTNFTRPVLFDYRQYNQNLTTGSILIEVGSHGNTLEQAEYSGELIGKSLVRALEKITEE
ncbi:MAG: stage II sporulation protein P [Porcipelethomonas sp.]